MWDLPTRLFHWLLVLLIAFSWWSGKYEKLDLHIWSGVAILTLLIFRLLWGFFGSSTAQFRSFVRGPKAVLAYLRDVKGWRPIGHSPLGALSVVAMLGALVVQVGLGLFSIDKDGINEGPLAHLVSLDLSEKFADLHEDWFNVVLVVVGLHIVAILVYRLVLGKKLIGPMIGGNGALDADVEPMRRGRWWAAWLCLAVSLGVTRWIVAGAPPL